MIGNRTRDLPTCSAVPQPTAPPRALNKRQDNKLKNYCVRLVIYLNCTMTLGLTNLKFYI
jgi:hypothetical protein